MNRATAIIHLERIVRQAIQSAFRNIWLSVAATAIMVISLFTVSVFFMFSILVGNAVKVAQEKVNVAIVTLTDSASPTSVENLIGELRGLPVTDAVRFVSKDEALVRFKERYKNDPLLLEAVKEENPLLNSVEIKVKDPRFLDQVKTVVEKSQYQPLVKEFSFEGEKQRAVERIVEVSNFIRKLGLVLSALFVATAILIIFNTVRITIFSRRTEIEIMQLVGATKDYIRSPFVLEGAVYGILGAFVAMGAMVIILQLGGDTLIRYFGPEIGNLNGFLGAHFLSITAGQIGLGAFIGSVSSLFAVSRYLRL